MKKGFSFVLVFMHLYCLTTSACAEQTLTLSQAIQIALNSSPTMQKSSYLRAISKQNLIAERASLKAKFSIELNPLSYTNTRRFDERFSNWYDYENISTEGILSVHQPIISTNTTISLSNRFGWQNVKSLNSGIPTLDKSFINDLYLNLKQPLFSYNSQRLNLKESELNFEKAEIEYLLNYLELERTISILFYNLYLAQLSLEIAEKEFQNTSLSRNAIQDKVETGMAAKIELYQADLNLASAKSNYKNRLSALEQARINFKLFSGINLEDSVLVIAELENIEEIPITTDEAIDMAYKKRLELSKRKIEIETEAFNLIKVKDINDFDASVTLSVGISGNDRKLNQIYNNHVKSPELGVSLNIPLYDWGERKARIKAQEYSLKIKNINLENEKKEIAAEIFRIYKNIENYKEQISIEVENERNAELAYEISLEKFKNGDLTGMDLNLYQTQLSNRKTAISRSRINYKLELLNLNIATLYKYDINILKNNHLWP